MRRTFIGTAGYVAPEISALIRETRSIKRTTRLPVYLELDWKLADSWSYGLVALRILSRELTEFPWDVPHDAPRGILRAADKMASFTQADIDLFVDSCVEAEESRRLIKSLLRLNPKERASIETLFGA